MSSDDSGFDKEAEREKLREKYERDEENRENTRRMSELLLQGATMTGKHCNQCGDPIFRYDGQEFCPTCQQETEGGGTEGQAGAEANEQSAGAEADEQSAGDAASAETGVAESPPDRAGQPPAEGRTPEAGQSETSDDDQSEESDDERSTASDEPRVEIDGISVADRHADRSDLRRPPSQQDGSHQRAGTGRGQSRDSRTGPRRRADERPREGDARTRDRHDARTRGHSHDARGHSHDAHDTRDSGRTRDRDARAGRTDARTNRTDARAGRADVRSGDLDPARETLVRTLTDLARRAEETDDATRVRELLGATREAAEALAALDRANR